MNEKPSDVAFKWWLLTFTVGALTLRLWNLSLKPIWKDEAALWMEALGWNSRTSDALLPRWTTFSLMWLLGDTSFRTLHFLPALFGSLSVFVTGFVGKELSGKRVGLIGAALLAVSPGAVFYSREARPYGFLYFGASVLLFTFLRARRRNDRAGWAGYSAAVALATCCHYVAVEFILAFGLCVAVSAVVRRDPRQLLWFTASSIFGGIPAALGFSRVSMGVLEPAPEISWSAFLARTVESLGPSFFSGSTSPTPVAWGSLVIASLSVPLLLRRGKRFDAALLAALFFTVVTVTYAFLGSKADFGLGTTRYTSHLFIPYAVMLGLVLSEIARRFGGSLLLYAVLAVSVNLFFQSRRIRSVETKYLTLARLLPNAAENRGIILFNERILAIFQYYYRGEPPLLYGNQLQLLPTRQIFSRGGLRMLQVPDPTALAPQLLLGNYYLLINGTQVYDKFCLTVLKGTLQPTPYEEVWVCHRLAGN